MSEEQRIWAAELLDATVEAIERDVSVNRFEVPGWSRVTLRRLPDRRAGADVTAMRGRLRLRSPLSRSWSRPHAEIVGPVDASHGNELSHDTMVETLQSWRTALGRRITDAEMAAAARIRTASTMLITTAAHVLQPGFEMATLESSRQHGHIAKVYTRNHDGSQRQDRFVNCPAERRSGALSAEFSEEFDRILGRRRHAHVLEDSYQRWVHLRFDETPTFIARRDADAMTILRSLNALPEGVRLIATRDAK